MRNGDAAAHDLAKALGAVVEEAVNNAVKPLSVQIDSLDKRIDRMEERRKADVIMLVGRIDTLEQRVVRIEGMMKSTDVLSATLD